MTWKELGTGLQAVRDGHDLPHRVAEGLIALGYIVPGAVSRDFAPSLTSRGLEWLTRFERVEVQLALGTLPTLARSLLDTLPVVGVTDPRDG